MDTNLNRLALSFDRGSFSVFLGQSKLKLLKPFPSHSFIFVMQHCPSIKNPWSPESFMLSPEIVIKILNKGIG